LASRTNDGDIHCCVGWHDEFCQRHKILGAGEFGIRKKKGYGQRWALPTPPGFKCSVISSSRHRILLSSYIQNGRLTTNTAMAGTISRPATRSASIFVISAFRRTALTALIVH